MISASVLKKSGVPYGPYGINRVRPLNSNNCSIHAENDLMMKLPINFGKTKTINLLVIRISDDELRNSKPCGDCIFRMKKFMNKKNYNIKFIFYSNDDGSISKTRFTSLDSEENKHICKFMKRIKNTW